MKSVDTKIWDVVVIGGGPAGMMAAGRAAELGKSVLLLEKNTTLGKKLLITGGGRCNITNNKEMKMLVDSYKGKVKALFSLFSQFGSEDTIQFFESRGLDTKEENEGRMFPVTDKAQSVWDVLLDYMKEGKVNIQTNNSVLNISSNDSKTFSLKTKNGIIKSKSCIVACGGISRPETGSTGDGFKWLENLGHTITDNRLALVPLAIKETWVKDLAGLSLDNIKINFLQDNKKVSSKFGKVLFTHFGVSGPTILNMSSQVREMLGYGKVSISLDLYPDVDQTELKNRFYELLLVEQNKKLKNTLGRMIPSKLVRIFLNKSNIDLEKFNHSVTKEERKTILDLMKGLDLEVAGLLGADKAVVSSGGVDIDEVNFKTMESKIVPNLYIIGDLLNIDRPSGGYSLQLCWAGGYVAGENC